MSTCYLEALEYRLRELFEHVAHDGASLDDAVDFVKEEVIASYRRGCQTRHPLATQKAPKRAV